MKKPGKMGKHTENENKALPDRLKGSYFLCKADIYSVAICSLSMTFIVFKLPF